jgi:hypothetical protein
VTPDAMMRVSQRRSGACTTSVGTPTPTSQPGVAIRR